MRFIKNFIFIASTTVLAILIAFLAFKNTIAKKIIIAELKDALGTEVTIKDIGVSPLGTNIEIQRMSIASPEGFEKKEMVYIPSIYLVWNPVEFIQRRRLRIFLLVLDIERINIIRNKDGLVNIEELKVVKDMMRKKETDVQEEESSFYLDIFRLTFTDIYYTDYHRAAAKKPTTHTYAINIQDELFDDLDDGDKVAKLIMYKIFSDTNIGKLINFNIKMISSPLKLIESEIEQTIDNIFFILK